MNTLAKQSSSASVAAGRYKQSGSRGSAAAYLMPVVESLLPEMRPGMRVLDVGCGNGFWAGHFLSRECSVVGIDASSSGIAIARAAHPDGRFEAMTVSRTMRSELGEEPFDLVTSFEVVEHLYAPRDWAAGCFHACAPGGTIICSTPYHGYLKNLLVALRGQCDAHYTPLVDGGHIKFWSKRTLSQLLCEAGFQVKQTRGAGRVPYLWKSMVVQAIRPE